MLYQLFFIISVIHYDGQSFKRLQGNNRFNTYDG